ncbi:hypothetical protein D9M71_254200 [compost metagenome]
MNALDETVERSAEGAEFVIVLDGQAFGQVTFAVGDVGHGAGHDVQRLDQDANQHAEQGDDDGHGNDGCNHSRGAELAEHRVGFFLVDRQTDVPVDRWQALDRGKADNAGLAVDVHFAEAVADARGVFRIRLAQGLHHQRFVRVNQDLAVGADQKRVTHAIEVAGAEGRDQGLQAQVATHHTNALSGFFRSRGHRDDQLTGCRIDVGFGQGRRAAVFSAFVPGANTRIETVGHLRVRTNGEVSGGITQVGRHESRRQGFLLKQAGDIGLFGVDGDVLREVLDQQNTPGQPGLDVVGGDVTHLVEIVIEVFADGIALQIVVVQRE